MDKRFLGLLQDSAVAYSGRKTGDETLNNKLIQLGRRRAQRLVHGADGPQQYENSPFFFGLLDTATFISVLRNLDSRIRFLRNVATSQCTKTTPADAFIIRYRRTWTSRPIVHAPDTGHLSNFEGGKDTEDSIPQEAYINKDDTQMYDGNAPAHGNTQISDCSSAEEEEHEPVRKVAIVEDTLQHDESAQLSDDEMQYSAYASCDCCDDDLVYESGSDYRSGAELRSAPGLYSYATAVPMHFSGLSELLHPTHHRWTSGPNPSNDSLSDGETETLDADGKFMSWPNCIRIVGVQNPDTYTYYATLGNKTEVALFVRRQQFEQLPDRPIGLEDLLWCLEQDLIDPATILRQLCVPYTSKPGKLLKTLGTFAAVAMVYDDLPDMTIDVGVLERPIAETRWAPDLLLRTSSMTDKPRAEPPSQSMAFAIIAYLESGIHDVDPRQLQSVVALSAADSLFVSQQVSKPIIPLKPWN